MLKNNQVLRLNEEIQNVPEVAVANKVLITVV